MAQDFLLELGTEELPDRELNILSQALETAFIAQLNTYALSFSSTKRFATPRRLALFVSNVSMQQPVQQHNRKGPALSIAFQDGKPTTALKKFAQACHVSWEELTPVTSEKGTWMTYQATTPGQSTYDLLPSMIQKACDQLPLSKKMKWGAHLHEFLRPIHWIIALFDQTIIPIQLWNIQAHNKTQGHRIHCHQDLIIDHPSQYERLLTEKGFVIPDFHARKQTILHLINTILMPEMRPNLEPTLLDTITGLTEWPVPILGQFDQHFLSIPKPVLIAAIEDQQKCLTIIDKKDQLMPYFIAVANLASSHPIEVIAGYERVIRSRLSDAQFFYEQDQRSTLLDKRQKLQDIIFQNKLGSIYNKTERLAAWMT
ncbi:MAG: glycine--tRNA ligase subunit beta [Endozoicomonadaceae bacterium]|nr:glycine--tRNA ligase subunit beta [Endozoicomonadaceae bacterium]